MPLVDGMFRQGVVVTLYLLKISHLAFLSPCFEETLFVKEV